MKKCPYCAELIRDEAMVCRYCLRSLRRNKLTRAIALILLILVLTAATAVLFPVCKKHIDRWCYGVKRLGADVNFLLQNLKEMFQDMKSGLLYKRYETMNETLKVLSSQNE